MIEHVSLRCSDSRASRTFYEQSLASLGYAVDRDYGDSFGFVHRGRHDFWVTKGEVGTPTHLAFHADDAAAVDAFYKAALAHNIEAVIWDEELRKKKPRGARTSRRGRSSRRGRRKARRS